MCSTSQRGSSAGRAPSSARLSAALPLPPPNASRTGFSPENPYLYSACARLPANSSPRMGGPVKTPPRSSFAVSGKLVSAAAQRRAMSLFASPGVQSDSCVTAGMPSVAAAHTTGRAT